VRVAAGQISLVKPALRIARGSWRRRREVRFPASEELPDQRQGRGPWLTPNHGHLGPEAGLVYSRAPGAPGIRSPATLSGEGGPRGATGS